VVGARFAPAAVTKPDYHPSFSTTSADSGSILRIALAHTGSPVVGAALEEGGVVADTDQRPGIAGENHDWAAAEDRIHGTALIAELAQVRSRENGVGISEALTELAGG
jgi:hypothetical protein